MPNTIGPNGITIKTREEILAELTDGTPEFPGLRQIYGPDINLDANSPDGQLLAIVTQASRDTLELIHQIASSFDPDQAVGRLLDQRCAINGVQRRAGTYTAVQVNVTTSRSLTLPGLDRSPDAPFTIADAAGTRYGLISTTALEAGTTACAFRALKLGAIAPAANSLTVVQTVTLGVESVNNPTAASTVGTEEESDYSLRLRRQQSVARASVGFVGSLRSELMNVDGVTDVKIFENSTGSIDANAVSAHSVWVIVAGTASAGAIANAIYAKRHAGTGQKGNTMVGVLQEDGTYFDIRFDRPTPQTLWIKFDVVPITAGSVDANYIRDQLLARLAYSINQPADTTTIVTLIREISPNTSVSNEGVSANGEDYATLLLPTSVDRQFIPDAAHIVINGQAGS